VTAAPLTFRYYNDHRTSFTATSRNDIEAHVLEHTPGATLRWFEGGPYLQVRDREDWFVVGWIVEELRRPYY
jgi:hypothetical protein